tara:strand:+ start:887 stop:1570 length:684 start_codon:yes stop_codon:yes gene_type:complete
MHKIYAFIFAREKSVRLKNKNLQKIDNKSLLEHSISIAKQNKNISKIFVSSDSKKILSLAKKNNVYCIKRPKKLCKFNSKEIYSWQHAINYLKKENDKFDIFLSLPTTAPLRSSNDIKRLIKDFKKKKSDITITATKTNRYPFLNMIAVDKKGYAKIAAKENNKIKLNKFYEITTVGYISSPKYILGTNNYFSGKVRIVEIPRDRSIDIDDKFDLDFARNLYKRNNS